MAEPDPHELTDKEKLLVIYYRDQEGTNFSRTTLSNFVQILLSIGFVILSFVREDPAWGLMGYAILLWNVAVSALSNRQWALIFKSLFAKYEARIETLTEAARPDSRDPK